MQVGKSEELREWARKVIEKMPHLTKPQAVVLAMWSFGIVMSQSSGLTTWYRDAKDKKKLDGLHTPQF